MDENKKYKNKAKCLVCDDVIESEYGYDFKFCKCGNIFVDGGNNYWRYGGNDMTKFERIYEERET